MEQPLFYRLVSISIVHPTQPRGNRPKLKKASLTAVHFTLFIKSVDDTANSKNNRLLSV